MQLSFLGKSYEASFPNVEATDTQETGTFLGKTYARKQFTAMQPPQSPARMTYRGIRYIR